MIRSLLTRPFCILLAFVFILLSIPKEKADTVRKWVISGVAPTWGTLEKISHKSSLNKETVEVENHMLRTQMQRIREWILSENHLEKQMELLGAFEEKTEDPFFQRRAHYLTQIIDRQLHALPAKVIYREPATWSSTIWLNVGQRDNEMIGREIVAKDSPVVVGKCVVGVVETVMQTKCRVRLITDQALTPSVRVVRDGEQNRLLYEKLSSVIDLLQEREDLFGAEEVTRALKAMQGQLDVDEKEQYLAKGQLHGANAPLWRMEGHILKGIGFNYDFEDEEGPARNLRTGAILGSEFANPLIKTGDLLVTSGMDGIFPVDLPIAVVTKILKLHEGGCSYSLEAKPLVSNLNSLREVAVLPPN